MNQEDQAIELAEVFILDKDSIVKFSELTDINGNFYKTIQAKIVDPIFMLIIQMF